MLKIINDELPVYAVESEPGDGTRYSYYVYYDGYEFRFMPKNSTFNYSQLLTKFEIQDINTNVENRDNYKQKKVKRISEKFNCNSWTVLECVRCMRRIILGQFWNSNKRKINIFFASIVTIELSYQYDCFNIIICVVCFAYFLFVIKGIFWLKGKIISAKDKVTLPAVDK